MEVTKQLLTLAKIFSPGKWVFKFLPLILKNSLPGLIMKGAFFIRMNIIDEIQEAWALAEAELHAERFRPANAVVIPADREQEFYDTANFWPGHEARGAGAILKVFGCQVYFSVNADKIKAGYLQ